MGRECVLSGVLLGLSFLLPYEASAQSKCKTEAIPLRMFTCYVVDNFINCHLQFQTALLKGIPVGHTVKCIDEYKGDMVPVYDKARRSLAKSSGALSMLKDVYASWVSAMDDLSPRLTETARSYANRVKILERQLRQMSHRLELEVQ
jgi:hypothetical protein